jgi:hypothetical protein
MTTRRILVAACVGATVSIAIAGATTPERAVAFGCIPAALVTGYEGHRCERRFLVYAGQAILWLAIALGSWHEGGPLPAGCLALGLWSGWDAHSRWRQQLTK